jgi:hypothetical protein
MTRVLLTVGSLILLTLVAVGCGPSGTAVKKGDLYTATEEVKVVAQGIYDGNYDESFDVYLPQGTVLQAIENSPGTGKVVGMYPTQYEGITDPKEIEVKLVPTGVASQTGFKGFYISVAKELLGTKLKKM